MSSLERREMPQILMRLVPKIHPPNKPHISAHVGGSSVLQLLPWWCHESFSVSSLSPLGSLYGLCFFVSHHIFHFLYTCLSFLTVHNGAPKSIFIICGFIFAWFHVPCEFLRLTGFLVAWPLVDFWTKIVDCHHRETIILFYFVFPEPGTGP